MFALLAHLDSVVAVAASGTDFVLAASGGGSTKLVNIIQNFLGPLFLLAIGLAAMTFLYQRQVTQFLQFMALAVGIAVLFYYPEVIKNVAGLFSKAF